MASVMNIANTITVALIILFTGFIIAKFASKIAKRVMHEAEINRILKTAGFKPASDTIGQVLEYLIYAITILAVLQQLGLTTIAFGILSVVLVIILAFVLLLFIRDFIPNAATGIFLRKKLIPHVGKTIQLGPIKGKLERVGVVSSVITNTDTHHVPHLYASKHLTQLRVN